MPETKAQAWWATQKFGKLRLKNPIDLSTSSKKKLDFVCECGKEKSIVVHDVTSKRTTSCARCNEMGPEWWTVKKFGRLRLVTPRTLDTGSHVKENWSCDCGKTKPIIVKDVTTGKTVSCNACNEMPAEWWSSQKFGRLKLKTPKDLNKCTKRKEIFVCNCGHESAHDVKSVTSGLAHSCGKCVVSIRAWYERHKRYLQNLKTPISIESFPRGGPIPMEIITRVDRPFLARCPHCDDTYRPRLASIKAGKSLICGCSAGMISGPNIEIQQFITLNGFEAELEYRLCGYKYDIHIKKCKTLIEFQGTRYHSSDQAKSRDKKKKHLAEMYGYTLIQIDEQKWRKKKDEEKNKILAVLQSRKNIGHSHRCKNEILAKLEELDLLGGLNSSPEITSCVESRRKDLMEEMKSANEDIVSAAISSHHVMCSVKNMGPEEAFGNDPFVYYGLGLVGEAGELTGALLRVIRNGGTHEDKRIAIEDELADCLIYAIILAYSTGVDLVARVNEKARVVESRARAGYYGGPIR